MIAEWPIAVLVLCSVVALVCTVAGLLIGNLPDFSEPLMVSPYRRYINTNRRKICGPTSDMFFLPCKMSLCCLPSWQTETVRQDSKSRGTLERKITPISVSDYFTRRGGEESCEIREKEL